MFLTPVTIIRVEVMHSHFQSTILVFSSRRYIHSKFFLLIEYNHFQTHCANDFSKESKRQTIYTQDVISALKELSFGDLEKPLEEFLEGTEINLET